MSTQSQPHYVAEYKLSEGNIHQKLQEAFDNGKQNEKEMKLFFLN